VLLLLLACAAEAVAVAVVVVVERARGARPFQSNPPSPLLSAVGIVRALRRLSRKKGLQLMTFSLSLSLSLSEFHQKEDLARGSGMVGSGRVGSRRVEAASRKRPGREAKEGESRR
jgi:hypothetical protein